MKLLIDTSLDNLFINLVDESFGTIATTLFREKKKADALHMEVVDILDNNEFTIEDIKSIYVTMGPGSFMGARTALVYARTIAQVSDIKLFVASSFALFDGKALIDAKGKMAYTNELTLVKAPREFTQPNYRNIIVNPKKYMNRFKQRTDWTEIEPLYVKDPLIGGK